MNVGMALAAVAVSAVIVFALRAFPFAVFGKNRQLFGLARRIDRNFDGGIAYGYSVHLNALPFR